jgi:uncharacterized protein
VTEYRFDSTEARVLGALIEKRFLTPEYYPLTLNSLVLACNQKSSRSPVMSLSEDEVVAALDSLRRMSIVGHVITSRLGSSKYQYEPGSIGEFDVRELAILCVLLLRGPQTLGEIRSRTERIYSFSDLGEVSEVIEKLVTHVNGPFTEQLPREPGRKERRYCHLLSDPPDIPSSPETSKRAPMDASPNLAGRVDFLEQEIIELKRQLNLVLEALDK